MPRTPRSCATSRGWLRNEDAGVAQDGCGRVKAVVCRTAEKRSRRLVIAHRGASGYRPEHTLEAYRLAIEQGADFIEPDLVATADGVLVARHENELSATTDVAAHPRFRGRRTTKRIDGHPVTGWFTEDFTLEELRSLRARERHPHLRPDSARHDGLHPVPTLAEIVRLAKAHSTKGRRIGIYPETKHPTYFATEGRRIDGTPIGLSLGDLLIGTLLAEDFTDPDAVFIQSFEVQNLIELRDTLMPRAGVAFPLVQLLGEPGAVPYDIARHFAHRHDVATVYPGMPEPIAMASPGMLRWMKSRYADAIGVRKDDLLQDTDGLGPPVLPPLFAAATGAGLQVHAYTLRSDDRDARSVLVDGRARAIRMAGQLYRMGVSAIFFDQPDLGTSARDSA